MISNIASPSTRRPRWSGPLQAVIFDWAGTTVDFGSRAPVLAVVEAFRSLDVPITLEQARAPMGKAKREHIQTILDMPEVAGRWRKSHTQDVNAAVDMIYERFLPFQKQILANHAALIPGCLESVQSCRALGMKIGSSTGYYRELMDILVPLAAKQGYRPDAIVCASDVAPGRPAPWMCWENARQLGVYPTQSVVKVDDTIVGIDAGLNAGMWTVGVAASGNLVGLSYDDYSALSQAERRSAVAPACEELTRAGAHVVVDSIADLPNGLAEIQAAVNDGGHP